MSNTIARDMAEIVWAAAPELRVYGIDGPGKDDPGYEFWKELWASIKPIKYGNTFTWDGAELYTLARYAVPDDSYHLIVRVDCYTTTWVTGGTNIGVRLTPPPGSAYWQLETAGSSVAQILTDEFMPVTIMLEREEWLLVQGGYEAVLIGNFTAPPTGTWTVRSFVMGYNVGDEIASRIGSNQAAAIITG